MNDHDKLDSAPDRSSFDADAFLARASGYGELFEQERDATIESERRVLDALEEAGFSVHRIRDYQAIYAPNMPLGDTVRILGQLEEYLYKISSARDASEVHDIIIHCLIVEYIASYLHKATTALEEEAQSLSKTELQLFIYADTYLVPAQKTLVLAAIEKLYPDTVGLKPDSIDTLHRVHEYVQEQTIQTQISARSRALRGSAHRVLRKALAEQGVGQHDQLDDLMNSIVVTLTRQHVIETGHYSTLVREGSEIVSLASLAYIRKQANEIGWSDAQLDAMLQSVRSSLSESTD